MRECEMPLLYGIAGLWTLLAVVAVVPLAVSTTSGRSGRWGKVGAVVLMDVIVLLVYGIVGSLPSVSIAKWGAVAVIASLLLFVAILYGIRKAPFRASLFVALGLVFLTTGVGYGAAMMQLHGEVSGRDSTCRSRLTMMHRAVEIYRDGHDGRMPPVDHWREAITPYIGGVAGKLPAPYGPKTYFECHYSVDATYHYTGQFLSPEGGAPVIYCRHRSMYNAGPRVIVLYADGEVRVIPGSSLPERRPERD